MYQWAVAFSIHNSARSHLKKVFSSDIGVEPSSQILDILEYACGLSLGLALISTENPNFEIASNNILPFCRELYYNKTGFSLGTSFALPYMNKTALPETKM